MSEQQPTPWELAADEVLAAVIGSDAAWHQARFDLGLMAQHMPPGYWRTLFLAADELRLSEQPVHITGLVDRVDGRVPLEWISERVLLYSPVLLGDALRANVGILKVRGVAYNNLTVLQAGIDTLKKMTTEDERARVIGNVITQLSVDVRGEVLDATAGAAGARFEAMMQTPPPPKLSTGINWIDRVTGGFHHGEMWWIAGAYKMRKSTMMRAITLETVRQGSSVTIATVEGNQKMVIAQFVAMLAAEWMHKNGHYNALDAHGHPLNVITSKMLLTLHNRYKSELDPRQVAAINYGILEYKRLGAKLRIYDSLSENGGLSDLNSIHAVMLRDKQMYGIDVVMIDYLQRVDSPERRIYDRVSRMALDLQGIALKMDVAMLVLAQRNESAITGTEDDHSPGVKGGGDPAATADYLFLTRYPYENNDGTEDNDRMEMELRLARHGEAKLRHQFPLHAPSGWLLPEGR